MAQDFRFPITDPGPGVAQCSRRRLSSELRLTWLDLGVTILRDAALPSALRSRGLPSQDTGYWLSVWVEFLHRV